MAENTQENYVFVPSVPKGQLESFDEATENFSSWYERFELYCELNDIAEPDGSQQVKKNLFLTTIGSKHYNVLHRQCLPNKPKDKTLVELKNILVERYEPKGIITTNRFTFSRRDQKTGETFKEYIESLQQLASKCDFGANVEDHLRDRVVCGILNENVQRKLLSEVNLTYERTKQIILQEEAVAQYAKTLNQESNINKVWDKGNKNYRAKGSDTKSCQCQHLSNIRQNASNDYLRHSHSPNFNQGPLQHPYATSSRSNQKNQSRPFSENPPNPPYNSQGRNQKCYRCGRLHNPNMCPARFWTCFNCQRQGHISSCCRSKIKQVEVTNQESSESNQGEDEDRLTEMFGDARIYQVKVESEVKSQSNMSYVVMPDENISNFELVEVEGSKSQNMLNMFKKESLFEVNNEMSGELREGSYAGCNKMLHHINLINQNISKPEVVVLNIDNIKVEMEIDTGAALSIISHKMFMSLYPNKLLDNSLYKLSSVSGQLNIVGQVTVKVNINKYEKGHSWNLPLIICTENNFSPLLGRNWLDELVPTWRRIGQLIRENKSNNKVNSTFFTTTGDTGIKKIKELYSRSFRENADGFIEGFTAKLVLKEDAIPVFHKSYPLAYMLDEVVKQEIIRMEKEGKLKRVTYSEWASPVWPVRKRDGGYRICADVSRTVNPNLKIDIYPLPRIEGILQDMSGKQCYTVIDLSEAYLQLKVSPESQHLLTINTSLGLFQFNALVYGIASAPSIFQSVIDQILLGLSSVRCYLDDIIIGANSYNECTQLTHEVLKRLNYYNIRIKESKCIWFKPSVEYLGHVLDKDGYHPTNFRVKAILDAKPPKNIKEVKAYTGMLNFYSRFMPHMSRDLKPLYKLTEKNVPFEWSLECQQAFELSKKKLLDHNILIPYNPSKELVVSTDASPYGLGCVVSHIVEEKRSNNNSFVKIEKPIMFASCTLNVAQQKYSQIEREGLAVIFAFHKFYKYIWGRTFKLALDNAPLKSIFNPSKPLSILATERLIRWSLFIRSFNFVIEHRKSSLLSPADAMSRLPCENSFTESIYNVEMLPTLPLTVSDVTKATKEDACLCKVIQFTLQGWPNYNVEPILQPYFKISPFLSLEKDCLMFGSRVIIPQKLHKQVLDLLHAGHPGIVRCKMLARENVWWPSLNSDIALLCQSCEPCNIVNFKPITTEKVPWPKASCQMQRCHIDFFQLEQNRFLILVDSYSKWVEVYIMPTCNTEATLNVLRTFFATAGLPTELVSDNGPPFDSHEYSNFCSRNNILATFTPPYHPESNGLAERNVQTIKKGLKKLVLVVQQQKNSCHYSMTQLLSSFLLAYRTTPSTVTGRSPASMWLNFLPRTHLSLINPKHQDPSRSLTNIPFCEGDNLLIKLSTRGSVTKGIAVRPLGSNRYLVSIQGVLKSVSLNQISLAPLPNVEDKDVEQPILVIPKDSIEKVKPNPVPENLTSNNDFLPNDKNVTPVKLRDVESEQIEDNETSLRRSGRVKRPVERLDL